MTAGIAFVKRLLETFLTGLAIATGVSFVVFPVTCRKIVFKEFAGYLGALQGSLKAHQAYLQSLEDPDCLAKSVITNTDGKASLTPEALAVKAAIGGITALHGKLQGDLPFAKREIALGKLGADDLKEMNKLVRNIMLPTVGLGAVIDIFERIAAIHNWTQVHLESGLDPDDADNRRKILVEWSENIKAVHNPFQSIVEVMVEGLEHVALQLQLKKREKAKKVPSTDEAGLPNDVEAEAGVTAPGEKGFADYLEKKIQIFYGGKQHNLRDWCHRHGIELSEDFFDHPADAQFSESDEMKNEKYEQHQRNQRQLYLLLYVSSMDIRDAFGSNSLTDGIFVTRCQSSNS
jgi:hypothetical protein